MRITCLCALVWSADDGLVRVQDCTMSVFQSASFGNNKKKAAALERRGAKHMNLLAAQKQSV